MARGFSGVRQHDFRGLQLLALLLVAVVVPSASVLWFMNEAVAGQASVARSTLTEAYRGQLRLMRGRLQTYWQTRVATLETNLPDDPAAAFRELVAREAADSVIVLARGARPQYPSLSPFGGNAASSGSMLARAMQQAIRDALRQQRRSAAIEMITGHFLAGPASRGVDAEGRLIAADEQLLLIDLLGAADRRRPRAIARLAALLDNYSGAVLPAAQRVFLMEQLRAAAAGEGQPRFPTLAAERLALSFLEAGPPPAGGTADARARSRGLWQIMSATGRVVALYRTETLLATMRPILDGHTAGATFQVVPPGGAADNEAVALGSALPGWELTFAMPDAPPPGLAGAQRASYVAIALVAIAAAATAAAIAGGAARRQARLASLRSDLVSAVSHELKTPLASMRLLVDALLDDERLDPVKTREYLQLMSVENARLTRLIDNFLTFSRLERKRQQFTFRSVDPAELAREAVKAMPERRRGETPPALEIAPDLAPLHADPDALLTVLLNLLDNAYKYTPGDHRVSLSVAHEGSEIVFAVEDNGIGIAPRELKKIFRRFYRVDQRLAGTSAGTGLGLSIVDAIVRAHGGRVDVRSAPGQGSRFAVCLPSALAGAPV